LSLPIFGISLKLTSQARSESSRLAALSHVNGEDIPNVHSSVLASIRKIVSCVVPVRHNQMRM
jgi:hypothetical protein